jgi:hypothetical protein
MGLVRHPRVAAAVVAVLAAGAIGGGLLASGGSPPTIATATPAAFRAAMIAKLRAQGADFQWVTCLRNGRRYEGVPIVRCNVEFGEPHVEAYCAVFRGGRLVTSQDDPAIPCAPDLAGATQTIKTYN